MLNIDLQEHCVVLDRPLRNARGTWRERRSILVQVREGGVEAVGEAAPLPGYTDDTFEAAWRALRTMSWGGLDAMLDEPATLLCELGRRVPGSAAARFAVEGALLQLCARRRRQSLATLLARLLGRRARSIDTAAWIDGDGPEAALDAAHEAVERGHRTLKLKIGLDTERELRVARALRNTFGDGVRLRFDANGELTREEGLTLLRGLARLHPEFVEEPGPLALLPEAAALVPVALDESLALSPETDVRACLTSGLVKTMVVKPMALGLAASLQWVRVAERHGASVVVSHLLGGPDEMDLAEALACAVGNEASHGLGHHAVLAALGEVPRPVRRSVPEGPCL